MTIHREPTTRMPIPTRRTAAWHGLRVWAHVLLRSLRDLAGTTVQHHRQRAELADAPVIAQSRTPLWKDGRDDEFALVAGKVHNLRLARAAFDGIVVPAGSVLSFWRQLGRPSRWRGYALGREVRAGCVVPTVAGGLCQLSNALAACAVDAGFTLVERHAHTARIERDAMLEGAQTIDATVFWNYVDLRWKADTDIRVEVDMSCDELVVRLRASKAAAPVGPSPRPALRVVADTAERPAARGCLTCDETACFRHRDRGGLRADGTAALLLNGWTPEFARHLARAWPRADWFMPWVRPARRRAGAWVPHGGGGHALAFLASVRRTVHLRRHGGEGGMRQAALMRADGWLAAHHVRRLRPWHTHLVIDQSLLVPVAQAGALAGRTYEVLVHAMPIEELQRRLDQAASRWPEAATLRDFRASAGHAAMERERLRGAQRLVTPHADVARVLAAIAPGTAVEIIEWQLPKPRLQAARLQADATPVIVFPASALPRKGALELAEAARHLGCRVIVLGSPSSDARLWQGVDVRHVPYQDPTWLQCADVVALPAYVEHAPRALLAAIAQGVTVVASRECGLPRSLAHIEVPAGDARSLVAALRRALHSAATPAATAEPAIPGPR